MAWPLTFERSKRVLALGVALAAMLIAQQFEIASVKPADPSARPGRMGAAINTPPGRLSTPASTVKELLAAAYGVETYQVTGVPSWTESARFAIEGKSAGAANREQLLQMLRPLLADRFKLTFHRETRLLAVYALMVAKGGPKFHAAAASAGPTKLNLLGHNVDMAWFAKYLTRFGADKPVIDKTGLTGKYDLDLDMAKISEAAGTMDRSPTISDMFEATANALPSLGLNLVSSKQPVEMLVIDHVERPSAN